MQRQLNLWPAAEPAGLPIWEELDEAERTRLILALARLIVQAVRTPNLQQEDDHER
jgi:hypothetical protein